MRHQLLTFWRTPVALFFTLLLPLIMLLLFNSLFGGQIVTIEGGEWPVRQFYTGGLPRSPPCRRPTRTWRTPCPSVAREGVLKRWRSTPIPTGVYIGGFVGSAIVLAFIGAVFMLAIGAVFYDLDIDAAKMPAALASFVIGVGSFAALGMAVAALVPNAHGCRRRQRDDPAARLRLERLHRHRR